MMTLAEFLKDFGDQQAAALLGVSPRTVGSWRRRERRPRPALAKRIVELSGNRLNFEKIYAASKTDTA